MKSIKIIFVTMFVVSLLSVTIISATPTFDLATLSLKKMFSELRASIYLEKHLKKEYEDEDYNRDIALLDQGLELTNSMDLLISKSKNPYVDQGIRLYGKLFYSLNQKKHLALPHQIRIFEKRCKKILQELSNSYSPSPSIIYLRTLIEIMQSTVFPLCYKDMGFKESFFDYIWHWPKELMIEFPIVPSVIGLGIGTYFAYKGYCYMTSSRTGRVAACGVININSKNDLENNIALNVQQIFSQPQSGLDCGYFALINGILIQADPSGELIKNTAQHPEAFSEVINIWKNNIQQHRSNGTFDHLVRDEIERLMSRENIEQVRPYLKVLGVNENALQFRSDNKLANIYILEQDAFERSAAFAFSDEDAQGMQQFRDEASSQICVIANTPGHWVSLIAQKREQNIIFIDSLNNSYERYFHLIQGITQMLFIESPLVSFQMAIVINELAATQESLDRGNIPQAQENLIIAINVAEQYYSNPNFRDIRLRIEQMSTMLFPQSSDDFL